MTTIELQNSNVKRKDSIQSKLCDVRRPSEMRLLNQVDVLKVENAHLTSQVEKLQKSMKEAVRRSSEREDRIKHALKAVDRVANSKRQKCFSRDSDIVCEENAKIMKRIDDLEKEKEILLTGFKKQLQLIKNLKKQKEILESSVEKWKVLK